jgi:hypothetical protein
MDLSVFTGQVTPAADPATSLLPPWWQILGAFVLVIALLILFLRILTRLQAGTARRDAGLLETHNLGAGRSVEVLQYRDGVYTIYRNDGAAVLLEKQDHATYVPGEPREPLGGLNLETIKKIFRK